MQDRIVDRADLQFDVAGVAEFLVERNVLPAEFRRAHVHRIKIRRRTLPGIEQARGRLERRIGLAGLLEDAPHHAAHAVAAGAGLGAVTVVDADESFGAVEARLLQHHELVVGHTASRRCHRTGVVRGDRRGGIAHVDNDDLVADAVHLGKCVVGQRAHENSRISPALYGDPWPSWPVICRQEPGRCHDASVMGRIRRSRVRTAKFAQPGHAAGLRPRGRKAMADKLLGRIKMFRFRRLALAALIPAAALSFGLSATLAQTPSPAPAASASPSPVPSASPSPAASAAPVATPSPAASASPSPSTSPAASPATSPAASASPSPAPPPAAAATPTPVQTADPFGQETTLESKKVVMVKGTANWDSAFDTLIDAFKALNTLLDKQGIKAAGNSMIVYTSTDDTGFTFLAEIPVDQDPKNLPKDMSVGKSPEGKALKFVHRGSYDNMDNTYEAITNHLDDKKLEAKDTFIEEYLTDPLKTAEDKLVINVFVPLK